MQRMSLYHHMIDSIGILRIVQRKIFCSVKILRGSSTRITPFKSGLQADYRHTGHYFGGHTPHQAWYHPLWRHETQDQIAGVHQDLSKFLVRWWPIHLYPTEYYLGWSQKFPRCSYQYRVPSYSIQSNNQPHLIKFKWLIEPALYQHLFGVFLSQL